MPNYIDAFVLPVPKKNLKAYRKLAQGAAKIWMSHGALEYCECVGEDLDIKWATPFPTLVKPKKGETVVFSWIMYKSRAHRDKVNKAAMVDPRLKCDPNKMPFDCARMTTGGFGVLVSG